jgi:hypothetical protein
MHESGVNLNIKRRRGNHLIYESETNITLHL